MNNIDDYKKMGFSADQCKEIEEGNAVDIYAKPEYDWFQMEEIRKGLLRGVNVQIYADPSVSYERMRQIRKGLLVNIDLSPYKHMHPGILRVLRRAADKWSEWPIRILI